MATVLVVDDSRVMRRNLAILLTKAGHTVVGEAADGNEACTAYHLHRPDIVTMDITMPNMGGVAAVKKIISRYPDARIIMVSAMNQKKTVFEAIRSGAACYLLKPIRSEALQKVIDEALSGK